MSQTYTLLLLGRTVVWELGFFIIPQFSYLYQLMLPIIQLTCPRYAQMVTWTVARSIGFEPLKYSTITPYFGLEKEVSERRAHHPFQA
jgi:hypothetical protein